MTRRKLADDPSRLNRAPVRAPERLIRVRLACDALIAEGKPFRFADVAARAQVALSALHLCSESHKMIADARRRVAEAVSKTPAVWTSTLASRSAHEVEPDEVSACDGQEEGARPGPGELSVAEQAVRYLSGRVERGELQANSARVAQVRLSGLIARCGHLSPSALSRPMLLRWQATIGLVLSTSARRHYIGEVKRFTAWLAAEDLIASDPAASLVVPREPRRAPRALSRQDVTALMASLPGRIEDIGGSGWEATAIALMVGCGLRCVEVSRLDLADFDDWERTLTVHGKGGHERVLPVPAATAKILEAYIAQRGSVAGPLFKATGSKALPDGRLSPAWISKRTGRLMAQAGVHRHGDGRSAHSLRHTAASDVLDRCKDVRVVQEMLGHQSLATTQIYLRRADLDTLRKAMSGRDYSKLPEKKDSAKKAKKAARKTATARAASVAPVAL